MARLRHDLVTHAFVLLLTAAFAPGARAQCTWSDTTVFPGMNGAVRALIVFDDGTGEALYAGGSFTTAGGVAANRVARWDGSTWSALGAGVDGPVHAFGLYDDGTGLALYVGGSFANAGGVPAANLARWDGTSFSAVGSGTPSAVLALSAFDGSLWAGLQGYFDRPYIQEWNPQEGWSDFPAPLGLGGPVFALVVPTVFDPELYVGGFTCVAGEDSTAYIFRYDGSRYSGLQEGTQSGVYAITPYDDGGGHDLYAGGAFEVAGAYDVQSGGIPVHFISRWDGAQWSPVGTPPDDGTNAQIRALGVFDDGNGEALYAGGEFTQAAGVAASHMACWNGTVWSPLGDGVNDHVHVLQAFDDGSGPALYAGGDFTTAGGNAAPYIARWVCPAAVGIPGEDSPTPPVVLSSRPNPFASRVELVLRGSRGTPGAIEIFDVTGRMVRALATSALTPSGGAHTLVWDGHDQQGQQLGAGVYFVRLRWDTSEITRKIVRAW